MVGLPILYIYACMRECGWTPYIIYMHVWGSVVALPILYICMYEGVWLDSLYYIYACMRECGCTPYIIYMHV